MTTSLKVVSTPQQKGRRTEFLEFYDASYSAIVGELLALTGELGEARAVAAASFSRAWQAWPAICSLPEPEQWVRADAMTRAYAPARGLRLLQHGLPAVKPVDLDPEDAVLVAALQQLPMPQRLPLVLHYMAEIPASVIADWAKCSVEQVDELLDSGFEALVAVLDWPKDEDSTEDDEYEWTAEALQDSAGRLAKHITNSPSAVVFRQAAVTKWTKRAAPVSAAAVACVGAVSLLLPTEAPTQSAVFGAEPDSAVPGSSRLPEVMPAITTPGGTTPIRGITVAQVRRNIPAATAPTSSSAPVTGATIAQAAGLLVTTVANNVNPATAAAVATSTAATAALAGTSSSTTTPPAPTTTTPPPPVSTTTTTPPPPVTTTTTTAPPPTPPPTTTSTTTDETTTQETTTTTSDETTTSTEETTTTSVDDETSTDAPE